jgi:hypothetical protein
MEEVWVAAPGFLGFARADRKDVFSVLPRFVKFRGSMI